MPDPGYPQKYRTIVADPPWTQPTGGDHNGAGGIRASRPPHTLPYPTLNYDDLVRVPVPGLAERDAHLYLWTTNAQIELAYDLARRWHFKPSVLLTWCKTPKGMGLGGTFAQTTEHIIFARRGSLAALQRIETTWFHWPRSEHSRKPEAFLDLVESVSPGPYLELFARRQRLGWDTWGDEALEHVEIAS